MKYIYPVVVLKRTRDIHSIIHITRSNATQ